jgi:hypothetical protein
MNKTKFKRDFSQDYSHCQSCLDYMKQTDIKLYKCRTYILKLTEYETATTVFKKTFKTF